MITLPAWRVGVLLSISEIKVATNAATANRKTQASLMVRQLTY